MKKLAAVLLGLFVLVAPSQGRPQSSDTVYSVTYLEVGDASYGAAAQALRSYGSDARRAEGNIIASPLQQIGDERHFALVEVWQDQRTREAYMSSYRAKALRSDLQPILSAPPDERLHTGMAVTPPARDALAKGLVLVTHVDFEPEALAAGAELLQAFASAGRGQAENLRFDVLKQVDKPNHFSIVQVWRSPAGYQASIASTSARAFRERTLPLIGSPYDERRFQALE